MSEIQYNHYQIIFNYEFLMLIINYVYQFYLGGNGATAVVVAPATGKDISLIRLVGLGT